MTTTKGTRFFDGSGNRTTFEYSTEVPPTVASTWNEVPEVMGIAPSTEAAPESSFTSYSSDGYETKTGFARHGSWAITGIRDHTNTIQAAIRALAASGEERWWRVTYPLSVSTNTTHSTEMFIGTVSQTSPTFPDADGADPIGFTFEVNQGAAATYVSEAA